MQRAPAQLALRAAVSSPSLDLSWSGAPATLGLFGIVLAAAVRKQHLERDRETECELGAGETEGEPELASSAAGACT